MKVIGSHLTEEGVEIALFYIDDRHQGLAIGPQTGPEDTAGVLVEVKATSEQEAKEKLIRALSKSNL
jgi:hypothetical protein